MIADLVDLLERINALPLAEDERTELMRAAIAHAKSDGANIRRRSGPKRDGKPSVASQVRGELAATGTWMERRDISAALGLRSGQTGTALFNLVARGEIEQRKTPISDGRTITEYRIATADEAKQ